MAEKKYMERNKFLRELIYDANWRLKQWGNQNFTVDEIIDRVFSTPVADVVEVKHGKWKFNNDGSGTCSECHFTQRCVWDHDNWQNYCGVCGAKMDVEEQK